MQRSHTCGALRQTHIDQNVTLCGWVKNIRDKGALLWIDLRDRYGITQIVLQEEVTPHSLFTQVRTLSKESVIQVKGKVISRHAPNPQLPTGVIEVTPEAITLLNPSHLPPFLIEDETDGHEELRMQYRYLDLRRKPMQERLMLRHQINQTIRHCLDEQQFLEIETPTLIKSTPEGARDFVVPSRLHPHYYYALPQSPQLFKQLLMTAGMDRYYQIVKCFRDEDLRADRQPEFTQLDAELSFVAERDVQAIFEKLLQELFLKVKNIDLPSFVRMTYEEAMKTYGTDKPDLRWGMPFVSMTKQIKESGVSFKPFEAAQEILALSIPKGAQYSRKQLDQLRDFVQKEYPSLTSPCTIKYTMEGQITSALTKWYGENLLAQWLQEAKSNRGDLLLLLGGDARHIYQALGKLRLHIAERDQPTPSHDYLPLWVTDFPLLTRDEETQRYHSAHHPFTAPQAKDIPLLDNDPSRVKARAYDLVINGVEIGGGSIRIHEAPLQEKIFQLLGLSPEEATAQFGFFLKALQYGAPPHGGIALGLDRLALMLGGGESIRDYIAFPKNNAGRDVMINAPAPLPKG